jgi:hypothetical protein
MKSRSLAVFVTGAVVGALYLATAVGVGIRWLDVTTDDTRSMDHFFATRFGDMIDGRAYRPFVTRALLPGSVRLLRDTLPPRWRIGAQRAVLRTFHLRRPMAALGWEPERTFEYLAFGALALAAFACVPFAVRGIFRALFSAGRLWADMLPLPLLLLLDPMFVGPHARFMYDPATLALASLGTWAAIAGRKWVFYVIYVLAVLNKETAFLLAALFLVARVGDWRRHVVPLFGIWIALRLWIGWVFRDNPGSAAWWIANRNLARALADPWGIVVLGVALAVIAWSVWRWWTVRVVRIGIPALLGVLLMAYFLVGTWTEYRVFYEIVPLVWVTAYAALLRLCGVSIEARDSSPRPVEA